MMSIFLKKIRTEFRPDPLQLGQQWLAGCPQDVCITATVAIENRNTATDELIDEKWERRRREQGRKTGRAATSEISRVTMDCGYAYVRTVSSPWVGGPPARRKCASVAGPSGVIYLVSPADTGHDEREIVHSSSSSSHKKREIVRRRKQIVGP
jgi:hypothetical protein